MIDRFFIQIIIFARDIEFIAQQLILGSALVDKNYIFLLFFDFMIMFYNLLSNV